MADLKPVVHSDGAAVPQDSDHRVSVSGAVPDTQVDEIREEVDMVADPESQGTAKADIVSGDADRFRDEWKITRGLRYICRRTGWLRCSIP